MSLLSRIASLGAPLMIVGYFILRIWIGGAVKEHVAAAKSLYPGTAEEALIAMLQDESISANDKTNIVIWTLGQLHSDKALPLLKELYRDDPDGTSCYGKHSVEICQYELHKAIESIEGNQLISFAKLNK